MQSDLVLLICYVAFYYLYKNGIFLTLGFISKMDIVVIVRFFKV